jgi:chromosome segregation ATPase
MLLSILFLIMYSINSLKTGVVAIAEREKAKKEINEIEVKYLRVERKRLKKKIAKVNQVLAQIQTEKRVIEKDLFIQKNKKAFQEYTAKKRLKEIKSLQSDLQVARKSVRKQARNIASVNSVNAKLGQKLADTHQKLLYEQHLARNRQYEIKNLGSSLKSSNQSISGLKKENNNLKRQLANNEAKNRQASRAIASLEEENADLMGYKRNYKGLIKENEKLNEKIKTVENKDQIKQGLIQKISRSLSSHGVKGSINS